MLHLIKDLNYGYYLLSPEATPHTFLGHSVGNPLPPLLPSDYRRICKPYLCPKGKESKALRGAYIKILILGYKLPVGSFNIVLLTVIRKPELPFGSKPKAIRQGLQIRRFQIQR